MPENATPSGPGENTSPFSAPQTSLPKGGGAIRGIDEKFTANPVTGTGSLNLPLGVSPGRSAFAPDRRTRCFHPRQTVIGIRPLLSKFNRRDFGTAFRRIATAVARCGRS